MKRGKNIFKPTKKKTVIAVIAVIVAISAISIIGKGRKANTVNAHETDVVTRGDVDVTITGSASVEPYERYEIIPKVSGDIIYCPYDVGDQVTKGNLLYGFDTSTTDLNVERQKISLQQSKNNYNNALEDSEKLSLTAKTGGVISDLTIKAGQDVNAGAKIATIENTDTLEVVLPFTQSQINLINVGDTAAITSSKHMTTVYGNVIHKATASYAGSDGSALYNVTVSFKNPGALYAGLTVGGSVGDMISPGSGVIETSASDTVIAETNGTVSKVYYSNGDYVKKGAVIATLTSDDISDRITDSTLSYKSANLSMQQTEKDLEDYNITSPISGTVITKNSKAGDTIDKTNSSTVMMVIADVSRLKFELSIDELDVSKVTEGQEVSITCDALPGETFTGYITTVSVEGVAQNGVTTYSAEVVINEPGNLRPSMNIDAEVIVQSATDVLTIPSEDIKNFNGKSYVFIKNENAKSEKAKVKADKKQPDDASGDKKDKKGPSMPQAPEGFEIAFIETGISNDEYTEVISGLTENQEIFRQITTTDNSYINMMSNMGAMHSSGGMSGPPSGGMGGGPR